MNNRMRKALMILILACSACKPIEPTPATWCAGDKDCPVSAPRCSAANHCTIECGGRSCEALELGGTVAECRAGLCYFPCEPGSSCPEGTCREIAADKWACVLSEPEATTGS